ncbi:protein of unknown function [Microbacterium pygmaeum]|uniref:Uncharacterized protein n=2 Tax=Microbacterium pygmaeum TaxID=370764 RepID=A0A1G7YF56_9MICO|nr:protein of unknown function [Microbacterium pygmaeum]
MITAAWPQWWSDDAVGSTSAEAELRFSLARKLGLSATSLLDDEPAFVMRGRASFKRATLGRQIDGLMLTTVGHSLGMLIAAATTTPYRPLTGAAAVREAVLSSSDFVGLQDLTLLCWACGIPVVSQSVFPLSAKRMDAMTVVADGRPVILLARRTEYPAFLSFMVAHELGHIALGHVTEDEPIADFSTEHIDLSDYDAAYDQDDQDEADANAFALELLTGDPAFTVNADRADFNAAQVAAAARETGERLRVDPGFVALALGHSTKRWPQVYSAMREFGHHVDDLGRQLNQLAINELDAAQLSDDSWDYVTRALGYSSDDA